jgi:hypothetical protein
LEVAETLPPDGAASTIIQPQRARLPEVIYVELADYCNLNCMFCGREAEIKKTGDKGGYVEMRLCCGASIVSSIAFGNGRSCMSMVSSIAFSAGMVADQI